MRGGAHHITTTARHTPGNQSVQLGFSICSSLMGPLLVLLTVITLSSAVVEVDITIQVPLSPHT